MIHSVVHCSTRFIRVECIEVMILIPQFHRNHPNSRPTLDSETMEEKSDVPGYEEKDEIEHEVINDEILDSDSDSDEVCSVDCL